MTTSVPIDVSRTLDLACALCAAANGGSAEYATDPSVVFAADKALAAVARSVSDSEKHPRPENFLVPRAAIRTDSGCVRVVLPSDLTSFAQGAGVAVPGRKHHLQSPPQEFSLLGQEGRDAVRKAIDTALAMVAPQIDARRLTISMPVPPSASSPSHGPAAAPGTKAVTGKKAATEKRAREGDDGAESECGGTSLYCDVVISNGLGVRHAVAGVGYRFARCSDVSSSEPNVDADAPVTDASPTTDGAEGEPLKFLSPVIAASPAELKKGRKQFSKAFKQYAPLARAVVHGVCCASEARDDAEGRPRGGRGGAGGRGGGHDSQNQKDNGVEGYRVASCRGVEVSALVVGYCERYAYIACRRSGPDAVGQKSKAQEGKDTATNDPSGANDNDDDATPNDAESRDQSIPALSPSLALVGKVPRDLITGGGSTAGLRALEQCCPGDARQHRGGRGNQGAGYDFVVANSRAIMKVSRSMRFRPSSPSSSSSSSLVSQVPAMSLSVLCHHATPITFDSKAFDRVDNAAPAAAESTTDAEVKEGGGEGSAYPFEPTTKKAPRAPTETLYELEDLSVTRLEAGCSALPSFIVGPAHKSIERALKAAKRAADLSFFKTARRSALRHDCVDCDGNTIASNDATSNSSSGETPAGVLVAPVIAAPRTVDEQRSMLQQVTSMDEISQCFLLEKIAALESRMTDRTVQDMLRKFTDVKYEFPRSKARRKKSISDAAAIMSGVFPRVFSFPPDQHFTATNAADKSKEAKLRACPRIPLSMGAEESQTVEFKEQLSEWAEGVTKSSTERIRLTLSAMANTKGGVVAVGVTDTAHVIGVETDPKQKEHERGREVRTTAFFPSLGQDGIVTVTHPMLQSQLSSAVPVTPSPLLTGTAPSSSASSAAMPSTAGAAVGGTAGGQGAPAMGQWWKGSAKGSGASSLLGGAATAEPSSLLGSAVAKPASLLPTAVPPTAGAAPAQGQGTQAQGTPVQGQGQYPAKKKHVTLFRVAKSDAPFHCVGVGVMPTQRGAASTVPMSVSTMVHRVAVAVVETEAYEAKKIEEAVE